LFPEDSHGGTEDTEDAEINLKIINIKNPFNAPVYHEETVSCTMDISRQLASEGVTHGTVITADFQTAGRGRIRGRVWEMEREANLPFTILLRYPRVEDIPPALTLRAGLATALAIEDFASSICSDHFDVKVKWPNDIMIDGKKAAGILCEANDGDVFLGIGINVAQKIFPENLRNKATSILLSMNREQLAVSSEQIIASDLRFLLLEKILLRLYNELEIDAGKEWRSRLEQRLFKKGEQIVFAEGAADSGKIVKGRLSGIGEGGELLILPEGGTEVRSFINGELRI